MSAVLKGSSNRAAGIRTLTAWNAPRDDRPDPLAAELEEARAALAAAAERIAALETACIEARREGEAKGIEIGRAEIEDCNAEALARLDDGIDGARTHLADQLGSLERLAALLARESVAILVGDAAHLADMVERAVALQMSRLEAASVLHVTVSGADFADEAALKPLAASAGVKVTADPALPGGRCRMTLRLGNLDVGPADQWPRIAAVLTELGGLEE